MSIIISIIVSMIVISIITLLITNIIRKKKYDDFNKKYWHIVKNLKYLRQCDNRDAETEYYEKEFINLFK